MSLEAFWEAPSEAAIYTTVRCFRHIRRWLDREIKGLGWWARYRREVKWALADLWSAIKEWSIVDVIETHRRDLDPTPPRRRENPKYVWLGASPLWRYVPGTACQYPAIDPETEFLFDDEGQDA